jgi:large subunit ribosomal protein L25
MAETYTLQAEPREETGKAAKRLRVAGLVPAVLYGHKVGPLKLTVKRGELEKVYRQAGHSAMVEIVLPDGKHTVLIHEMQDDPTSGIHQHADFYAVKMDEKIKTAVPLVVENGDQAPAVRELDGILLTNLNELEIECLPGDLPSEITVDASGLETFDDSITVADLKVPEGVTVLNEEDASVATVTPPRTQEEVDEAAEDTELDIEAVEGMEGEPELDEDGNPIEPTEGEDGEKAEGGDKAADDKGGDKPDKE